MKHKEQSVLFKRTEKNGKTGTFFLKERKEWQEQNICSKRQKRTVRTESSFQKNGKEQQEGNILFIRMEKNGRMACFFQENRCPTLHYALKETVSQEWCVVFYIF